jgi:GGDEF domain-containing protein
VIEVSVSIGASAIDAQGNPLERADEQMYRVKRSAR